MGYDLQVHSTKIHPPAWTKQGVARGESATVVTLVDEEEKALALN
jgi:hypothetical protein